MSSPLPDEYDNSALKAGLMQEFDDGFNEPDAENSFGRWGNFELVGHGSQTNNGCGSWRGLKGCIREELHNIVTLDGKVYHKKGFVHRVHLFCHKATCPICYKSGWAVREAEKIEARVAEGSKRWGLAEHIIASVPVADYGLEYEVMRLKVVQILLARGVIGGVLIFHAFRYNVTQQWYWSPHFHVIGWILGGYGRCRGCTKKCVGCSGFEARTRKLNETDGYIVKVAEEVDEEHKPTGKKGERSSIFGTAWYQLNHASIRTDVVRFHVASWFGVASYRKLKVTPERKKMLCPICQHELVDLEYYGRTHLFLDRNESGYKRDTFEDLYDASGMLRFREKVSRSDE